MGAGSHKDDDGIISDINITPMVDVMLVLLVIFMITANFLKKDSININLPKVAAADSNMRESTQVAMSKDGEFYLDDQLVTEEYLLSFLTREAKYRPNMRVTLSADESISYGSVSRLMGLMRQSGITKIALSVNRGA
ncbi:MAG: biopolymer transporter ExbD [Leptospirales bacterium]|nr:biopolymer transporter ExbD [Leptospirales bacterium]